MSVPLPPEPSSFGPSSPCPNCGQAWPENAPACPNCGFLRPAIWPPTPAGQISAAPVPPRLLTGNAKGDIWLGLGISLVLYAAFGAGLLLLPILYLILNSRLPIFARGLGYGWLGGIALVFGAFLVCTAYFFIPSWH